MSATDELLEKLRMLKYDYDSMSTSLEDAIDDIAYELEQAIAATLGRPKAKSHPYGYEPDTGAFDTTRCECGCINDISATYCNDCGGEIEIDMNAEKEIYHTSAHMVFAEKHDDGSLEFGGKRYIAATLGSGTLTAEQVMAIAGKHQPDYCSDTHVCFDWQAIADELNAELENDNDYERKMDALLCRLTNGKWSKTRAYDLDFMEQCINEEFEMLYAKEPADAELGSDREAELEALAKNLYANAVDFNFKGWMPIYEARFAALGIVVEQSLSSTLIWAICSMKVSWIASC